MTKKFIALIGRANSGKTTCLNKFISRTNGVRFRKNGISAKCSFNGKTVFVVVSSPQERSGKETLRALKKHLDFFEKEANMMQLNEFAILMAFTEPKNPTLVKERIYDAKDNIEKRGYTFERIAMPKTKQVPSKDELDEKVSAKIKEIESHLI
jgi:GTPase SAR1 family protein